MSVRLGKRGLGILIAELWGLVFTPASGGLICTSSRLRKMLALVVTAFVVCFCFFFSKLQFICILSNLLSQVLE